jgi:D-alanyl-D-alanine carboxypeptidase
MSPAYNNLQAKTGTLGNASALSGYVKSLDGEVFVFSCIFNGPNIGLYKMTEDRIGSLLASFFYDSKDMSK